MSYFEQTQSGESRWWSWAAVTWLAFVGWIILQTLLFVTPLIAISGFTSPPMESELLQAIANSGGTETSAALSSLSMWVGLAASAAILAALVYDGSVRKGCGVLAVFGVIISITASILSSHDRDNSAFSDVITQIMGVSPLAFALFLLTFPAGLAALYLCFTKIHKRSLKSLHTAAARFRWIRVIEGFFLTWIVLGVFAFIANRIGLIEVKFVFSGGNFWIYALVSLLFIPLQSATEEIVFRGYFNQGLTHLFKSKWVAFTLTSLAFMALHLSNPEALEGSASGTLPIVMSGYFFFGFAMCLIVWIDHGLETAIGIHAGNNCFAAVIMNYENSVLPTPSVFLTGTGPVKDSVSTVLVLAVIVVVTWTWRNRGAPRAL